MHQTLATSSFTVSQKDVCNFMPSKNIRECIANILLTENYTIIGLIGNQKQQIVEKLTMIISFG